MRILWLLVSAAATALAIWLLARDLLPPKEVSFAAGKAGGGYAAIAEQYARILARDGIEVSVVETAGSVENARLLAEGRVDVALLQGGIVAPARTEALAAVFKEPLLVYAREDAVVTANAGLWRGLRLAIGAEGSGTRAAALEFLASSGLTPEALTLLPLGGPAAAEALQAGTADVGFFVAPLTAPYLAPLFTAGDVTLVRLDYLQAISRRMGNTSIVTLPAGAVSLNPVRPAEPTPLIAMTARLVATDTLHPALVDRLVNAAREIHSARDQITREQEFPSEEGVLMPVDVYASDLIRTGPSPLSAYLPYWVVAQINRFAILLLPIIFLLLPLLRSLPGLYQWRMRAQVYQHYRQILDIDARAQEAEDPRQIASLREGLDRIDREISALNLPLAYRHHAYTARMHIDLVRARLDHRAAEKRAPRAPASPGPRRRAQRSDSRQPRAAPTDLRNLRKAVGHHGREIRASSIFAESDSRHAWSARRLAVTRPSCPSSQEPSPAIRAGSIQTPPLGLAR